MISETRLISKIVAPKKINNLKILLELNPKKYKNLHMFDKYLLLEELQRIFEIMDNLDPKVNVNNQYSEKLYGDTRN